MRNLPDYLPKSIGERARLIPVVADTSKEQRATSAFLAAMEMVDEYGRSILTYIGAPIRKTSKIEAYTEVSFLESGKEIAFRPDGLIAVRTGKRVWLALVEAKIGGNSLNDQQVEDYVDLARTVKADAVITISNQFASRTYHHPVQISRAKLRNLEIHHWSWGYLLTEAVLFVDHRGVSDPDQSRVLNELTRFLRHPSAGVVSTSFMPTEWKDICAVVRQEAGLRKTTAGLKQCVERWHELTRSVALQLSMDIGRGVEVHLTRTHENDPKLRVLDDINDVVESGKLAAELNVPDAAGRLGVVADLARRTLTMSMDVRAPQDRTIPSASVTWLRRQLEKTDTSGLLVCAKWPGRTPDSVARWEDVLEDPEALIGGIRGKIPKSFELRKVVELGGRFRGAKTFVESTSQAIPTFYGQVGQYLQGWVAPPPKVQRVEKDDTDDNDPEVSDTEPRIERPFGYL